MRVGDDARILSEKFEEYRYFSARRAKKKNGGRLPQISPIISVSVPFIISDRDCNLAYKILPVR
ncbi:MAG: hypothetical protein HDR48_03665 [Bacteroides sp.]|nr:hypothetical protein [Bacteroides sp.]